MIYRQRPHPGNWPPLQRALLCLAAFLLVLLLGWQSHWQPELARLERLTQEERTLKNTYAMKAGKTAALPQLQSRLQHANADLQALLQQLSPPEDHNAILAAIATAAQARGLTFESAQPDRTATTKGTQGAQDYASHAVSIRLSGRYDGIRRFAADIAASPRLVALRELQLSATEDGLLTVEAVVLSYHRHTTETGRRTPIAPEPEFIPVTHHVAIDIDSTPFGRPRSTDPGAAGARARPKQRGAPEPLENFPLESIHMVGTISQADRHTVLLQADGIVHQARTGDYAGKNFGMIRRISDHEIELEELVPDADGRWTPRVATLVLREEKQ